MDPVLLDGAFGVRELVLRDHGSRVADIHELLVQLLFLDVRADRGVHEHRLAVHLGEVAAVHLHGLGPLRARERRVQSHGDGVLFLGPEPEKRTAYFARPSRLLPERALNHVQAEPAVKAARVFRDRRLGSVGNGGRVERHERVARGNQSPAFRAARLGVRRRGVRRLRLRRVPATREQVVVELRRVERHDAERALCVRLGISRVERVLARRPRQREQTHVDLVHVGELAPLPNELAAVLVRRRRVRVIVRVIARRYR